MKPKTFIHVALVTFGLRKRNVSPEAEDLVRDACDLMLQHPDRYDQACPRMPVCGSVGCIAGYIQWAKLPKATSEFDRYRPPGRGAYLTLSESTAELLDVCGLQVDRFFYEQSWPARYRTRFVAAKTDLDRATVGVERMEHWLATDGLE